MIKHHTCKVEGCTKPLICGRANLCEMHYYRLRRTGSLVLKTRPAKTRPAKTRPYRYVYEHLIPFHDTHGDGPFLRGREKESERRAIKITWRGTTKTLLEWSKDIGITRVALAYRLKKWPLERAMTEPPGSTGPRGVASLEIDPHN
jgi:hypothetical protein